MNTFCDQVKIKISAGHGGKGLASFFREKSNYRGGPDGGDGGKGGDIVFKTNHNLNTLSSFLGKKKFIAPDGQNGGRQNKSGAAGENQIIEVPVGTIVYQIVEDGSYQVLADLNKPDLSFVAAKGGLGGLGNTHFATSINRSPRYAQPGLPGESKKIWLELKTIADIGLIGLPNSGKSTFLSVVTSAKPKIASYPFTTIIPNLGVMTLYDTNLIIADIPGLIEGASQGRGLGFNFLKHIERTRILVHLIDILNPDVARDYLNIRQELNKFNPSLSKKPEIICFTKIDALGLRADHPDIKKFIIDFKNKIKKKRNKIFAISAVTHDGLTEINNHIFQLAKKYPKRY